MERRKPMRDTKKKLMPVIVAFILGSLLIDVSKPAFAQGGVVRSIENPLQIAILHWYGGNQTASFAVGSSPFPVAFDGASIWVANGDDTVTKLRPSDGSTLGTFTVAVGFN